MRSLVLSVLRLTVSPIVPVGIVILEASLSWVMTVVRRIGTICLLPLGAGYFFYIPRSMWIRIGQILRCHLRAWRHSSICLLLVGTIIGAWLMHRRTATLRPSPGMLLPHIVYHDLPLKIIRCRKWSLYILWSCKSIIIELAGLVGARRSIWILKLASFPRFMRATWSELDFDCPAIQLDSIQQILPVMDRLLVLKIHEREQFWFPVFIPRNFYRQ